MAFKRAPGIGFLLAGIALVSGLYFPVDLLPSWMRWLSEVQPFTPAVNLLRHVLVGLPMPDPAWESRAEARRVHARRAADRGLGDRTGVDFAHRRGTLLEY